MLWCNRIPMIIINVREFSWMSIQNHEIFPMASNKWFPMGFTFDLSKSPFWISLSYQAIISGNDWHFKQLFCQLNSNQYYIFETKKISVMYCMIKMKHFLKISLRIMCYWHFLRSYINSLTKWTLNSINKNDAIFHINLFGLFQRFFLFLS